MTIIPYDKDPVRSLASRSVSMCNFSSLTVGFDRSFSWQASRSQGPHQSPAQPACCNLWRVQTLPTGDALTHVYIPSLDALMPRLFLWDLGQRSSLDSADSCLWERGGETLTEGVCNFPPPWPCAPHFSTPSPTFSHPPPSQNLWFRACSALKWPLIPALLPDPLVWALAGEPGSLSAFCCSYCSQGWKLSLIHHWHVALTGTLVSDSPAPAFPAQLNSQHHTLKSSSLFSDVWLLTAFQHHSSPPSTSHLVKLMRNPDGCSLGGSESFGTRRASSVTTSTPGHSSRPFLAFSSHFRTLSEKLGCILKKVSFYKWYHFL